jgi:fucose 4-O-acetylase-like acetyltransferase
VFPRLSARGLAAFVGVSLLAAYALAAAWRDIPVPWNAHIVLFALPFFYLGWLFHRHRLQVPPGWALLAGVLAFWLVSSGLIPGIDMKNQRYGWPVVSFVAAIGALLGIIAICRALPEGSWPERGLRYVGEASLTVMFLHQAFQLFMRDGLGIDNPHLRLVVGVVTPLLVHAAFRRHPLTRRLFLGDTSARAEPASHG